ncbi:MAG TPA: universal stress protein [Minicystis sp.]|nr:universal stress protein [Minicystis sp.]
MRRVLACLDLDQTKTNDSLLACARELAGPGGEIVILHVAPPDPEFLGYDFGPQVVRDQAAMELRKEHKTVQEIAAKVRESGAQVLPLTVQGVIVDAILEHAERLPASFIVLSSPGHWAVHDLVVPSTVRGVLQKSKVPVVVVPIRD